MLLANENAISSGGYQISNSLRFQSASSQYLSRTPSVAGNRQIWTLSTWVKRGTLSANGWLLGAGVSTDYTGILFNSSNQLQLNCNTSSTQRITVNTSAVYRDPSAWYHIVVAVDTTQATNSNGVKIYINGVQQTLSFSVYTQNVSTAVNNTVVQNLGQVIGVEYFDGYQAEIVLVDGQQLTPSSFGSTDPTSGQWVAAKYTGTYGTNGFYLPFSNGTSTTTLGADSSGNGNNWTLTNFTRSAGVSDCWMVDVPSGNGGATATQPNSNYTVVNQLDKNTSGIAITNGNLTATGNAAGNFGVRASTYIPQSGKWYWEVTCTTVGSFSDVGIADATWNLSYVGGTSASYGYASDGNKYNNGASAAYGATYTTGNVIGVALDMDAGTLTFYKNNATQGTAYTGLTGVYTPALSVQNSAVLNANFGQRSFAYTPPTGYQALCTANLPVATIKKGNQYMDAQLWTGDGVNNRVISQYQFKPDFAWIKTRSSAYWHILSDAVRGANQALFSNSTSAESTNDGNGYTSAFNTNGFTLTQGGTSINDVNQSGQTYVGWSWLAGNSTSSNTNGSITSTVSVNATAGFSIVTYTSTTATSATIGHGLGVAPSMMIIKVRNGIANNWAVYHKSLGNANWIFLNSTSASGTASGAWNTTDPTSSVFSVAVGGGTGNNWTNTAGYNYVAYCFAEIAGFSKFGSYTGNGSTDGTFVYLGFRPKFIMVKAVSGASAGGYSWEIFDTSRNPYNVANEQLFPNLSNAAYTGTTDGVDLLSNGFKWRNITAGVNDNGYTFIYMAFAENPFAQANAR